MATLQEMLRMQNIFGAPDAMSSLPSSGPADISAPPIVQPQQNPFSNINLQPIPAATPADATSTPAPIPAASGAPPPASSLGDGQPYDVAQRMREIYQPQTTAIDRFNKLSDQYPQRTRPTVLQAIAASLAMFGRGGPQMANQIINSSFQNRQEDWLNKMKFAGEAANYERYQNTNMRQSAFQTVAEELKAQAQAAKERNDDAKMQVAQHRASIYEFKATHPNVEFQYPKGGNIMYFDPADRQMHDTGVPVGSMTELDKLNLNERNTLRNIAARGDIQERIAGERQQNQGWGVVDIPDPDNPGQKISVRLNKDNGQIAPIIYNGKNVSTVTKSGTTKSAYDEITNQTKTMMEGSKMLMPHVAELRNQALNLEKNNLFGPVMSRVRNLAAKIGTTGTPEQIQASLDDFARAITNDPQLSQDAAVGQFTTSLGLMASGMGRVHGGARGGGSIQMINYLKNLLSGDSTYAMFSGRLSAIESYLKGYAAGPQSPANTNLDKALDNLFPRKQ